MRASQSGLLVPLAAVGKILEARTPIANIISEDGLIVERFFARDRSVVIAFPDRGYIQQGAAICTLAVPE